MKYSQHQYINCRQAVLLRKIITDEQPMHTDADRVLQIAACRVSQLFTNTLQKFDLDMDRDTKHKSLLLNEC